MPPRTRMPVMFVGHGSPMNAIEDTPWSRGFAKLAELAPRPKAVLAVSAHWFVDGTLLTGNEKPRTIHDFGGFPRALYEIEYPAPGRPDLAAHVRTLLGEARAGLDESWGLDHGTWSVLRHTYPDADIPVIQLSIDRRLRPQAHYDLARALAPLRDEGVLILASGNVTHNLRDAMTRMQTGDSNIPDWARSYDADVATAVQQHDGQALIDLWPGSAHARMAHPSPDHWLPLLYAQAASNEGDAVAFPTEGFDLGSLSMRNIVWG